MILRCGRLVFSDHIQKYGDVRVVDGTIVQISAEPLTADRDEQTIDLGGQLLAPGFIDLHIHGALRRDTMEADPAAFRTICEHHARGGTTGLALTTITAAREDILAVLRAVEK